jgi:hypothetical protein
MWIARQDVLWHAYETLLAQLEALLEQHGALDENHADNHALII